MVETTTPNYSNDTIYERWQASNIKKDLIEQGHLNPSCLNIYPLIDSYLSVNNGFYRSNGFQMRWIKNDFLVLMLEQDDTELVQGFSRILGLDPDLRYSHPDKRLKRRITYEWDMIDPKKRFELLSLRLKDSDCDITKLK